MPQALMRRPSCGYQEVADLLPLATSRETLPPGIQERNFCRRSSSTRFGRQVIFVRKTCYPATMKIFYMGVRLPTPSLDGPRVSRT